MYTGGEGCGGGERSTIQADRERWSAVLVVRCGGESAAQRNAGSRVRGWPLPLEALGRDDVLVESTAVSIRLPFFIMLLEAQKSCLTQRVV